jgi:hypothetical protein
MEHREEGLRQEQRLKASQHLNVAKRGCKESTYLGGCSIRDRNVLQTVPEKKRMVFQLTIKLKHKTHYHHWHMFSNDFSWLCNTFRSAQVTYRHTFTGQQVVLPTDTTCWNVKCRWWWPVPLEICWRLIKGYLKRTFVLWRYCKHVRHTWDTLNEFNIIKFILYERLLSHVI